ncbi:pyridoxal phosphate-dependent aminotransferase [Methanosphaerula subterraneus]|uniref:pyridoxal phosphate-dependent aminotransferase n=1 Tax=Methanosphaerula subterraneus TaxID=3350244 RepID=UPI003F86D9B7
MKQGKIGQYRRAVHGGILPDRSLPGKSIIDFSASMNPFPPNVAWDPASVPVHRYPDNQYATLRAVIAETFHRDPAEVAVGNGSAELMRVFCQVALSPGDHVRIDRSTFEEYAVSAEIAGAVVDEHAPDPVVRFVCNPNNPTGTLIPKSAMLDQLDHCSSAGMTLFLDEAFIDLAAPDESLVDQRSPDLFLLRSLTKAFSVPGIRFGYGFGDPELIEAMEAVRTPWSINAYAEQFAIAAFRSYDLLAASREAIAQERQYLCAGLDDIGIAYRPSSVNYLLLNPGMPAPQLTRSLLGHGVLVRDCTSFHLPDSIRVAVRTRDENALLLSALKACLD